MSDSSPALSIVPDHWPPRSIEAAESEMLDLAESVDLIQAQLADRNKIDEDGNRLMEHEFHQWRARAVWALKKKTIRRRRLKMWLKAAHIEACRLETGIQKPTNSVELMGALLKALRDATGDDMTAHEQALCSVAQDWIQSKGAPAVIAAREKAQVAS